MNNIRVSSTLAIILITALTACGGGGDDNNPPIDPVDPEPITKVVDMCVAKEQLMNCFTVLEGTPTVSIEQVPVCMVAFEGKPLRDSNTVRSECRE